MTFPDKKIPQSLYKESGLFPIVDQGNKLISGYCSVGVPINENLPYIIFGDHTRNVKYIDFPFFLGADGTQVLEPSKSGIDKTYFYFLVQYAAQCLPNLGYSRHFKELRNLRLYFYENEEEQKVIGNILFQSEILERKTDSLIQLKLKYKKALMQQLLTGKKRFKEFIKSNRYRNTKFHSYPLDWDYIPVSKIAKQVVNLNQDKKDLVVLSCTKYDGLVDSLKYFGRKIFSDNLSTYKIVKRGQFAYATNHIEEGSIGLLSEYEEALISPMYIVFEVNEKVDSNFIFRVFKTETYRHIFEVNTSGSINRRGGLRWADFSKINIPLPSIDEQKRIASFFSVIDDEIELLNKKLELFKLQKKGLMQKLLTGKIRVKV